MHSRCVIFFWRRKLLLFGSVILSLLGIWFWGILYTTHNSFENDEKVMSVKDLLPGGRHEGLLERLGFPDYNDQYTDSNGVRFVKPTGNPSRREKYLSDLNQILFDKDERYRIQHLDVPSRDEIGRRRASQHVHLLAEKQSRYEHDLHRMGIPVVPGIGPGGPPPFRERLVHLDLKGAPPKLSYLERLLPIFKTLGATGILLEYEDMFPYSGALTATGARNSYKRDRLQAFLGAVSAMGMTVIPLVQTFGHMEFILKLREFSSLREVPDSPQALCPSQNATMELLEEMVGQVVEFHMGDDLPQLTHLHIGCDEVFRMAECKLCRHKMRDQLFLDHVSRVVAMINRRWPTLKVIIWDDMLRHIALELLESTGIGKLVQPMIWVYTEDIYKFMQPQTWDKYGTVFKTVWVASAFKGAHGETLVIPPARRHLENTLRWKAVAQAEGNRFSDGVQGIALTGWQRYDHFAVVCELLPAALPSLALSLSAASRGFFDTNATSNPILSSLTCSEPSNDRHPWLELHHDPTMAAFSRCMFPGSPIFRFVHRLAAVTSEAREFLDNVRQRRGWLTDYNVRHNYSTVLRIEELLEDEPRIQSSVASLAKNAVDSMSEVYDHWTIGEYVEQRIYPLLAELKELEKAADTLKAKRSWPQRPLPYLKELELLGVSPRAIN